MLKFQLLKFWMKKKTVSLTLFVDPGQRAMVNRISFEGNERTTMLYLEEKCVKWKKVGFQTICLIIQN